MRSIRSLGTATSILLGVQLVLMAAQIVALIHRVDLVHHYQHGGFVNLDQADAADAAVRWTAGLEALVFIATVVVWCVWQHRAQSNARLMTAGTTTFTPGWAVGWWFVPIANLFKPFQTVRELWKASLGGAGWREIRTWSLLGWWWGVWIAGSVDVWVGGGGAGVGFQMGSDARVATADQLDARDTWGIVWLLARMVAAVLAIVIVRSIEERQRGAAPPSPLPPSPTLSAPLPEPPPPPV
jgi:Domain of unknown function (DUF4328)